MTRVIVALAFVVAHGGCSFKFVHGPNTEGPVPIADDCTTSRAWPITDLVFAALLVAGGIGAIIEANESSSAGKHGAAAAISMLPFGLGFAIASVVGFDRVGNCRDAQL
jgi:hypothetical protein